MECPICLEELNNHQPAFIFSNCLHKYHNHCYKEWFDYQGVGKLICPECNTINEGYINYKPIQKTKINVTKKIKIDYNRNYISGDKINYISGTNKNYYKNNKKSIDRCSCLIS